VYSLNSRKLYISSAYRTEQEQLDAIEEEGDVAANVGESEHQAGLAIDVYIKYYGGLAFLKTPEGRFVNTNCYKYGFIIRFPYYGEKITGITYEPWHLRFVGMPHAKIIEKNSITFEEYISFLLPGRLYEYGGYVITKQKGEDIILPREYTELHISPDNTGYYIFTAKLR